MASRPTLPDDDDISCTSSVSEAYNSDKEFDVDRVLAERGPKNNKYYLISWLDYPIEKATWEPAKNVGGNILEQWQERLQREKEGTEPVFDIPSWEAQVKRQRDEKADRHRRREAKRRRLKDAKLATLAERKAKEPNDSDSSSEAIEENEIENAPGIRIKGVAKRKKGSTPAKKKPFKAMVTGQDVQEMDDTFSDLETKIEENRRKKKTAVASTHTPEKSKPIQRVSDPDSEEVPSAASDQQQPKTQTAPSSSTGPPVQRASAAPQDSSVAAKPSGSARPPITTRISMTGRPLPSKINEARGDTTKRPRGGLSIRAGKSATRGGSNVIHKNVFEAREPAKQRGNLLKNATDATKDPKSFGKISFLRKAELQARDIAERAPDISVLGGLFDPSNPASIQPIRPSDVRKSTSNAVNQEGQGIDSIPNELFISKFGSPAPEPPLSAISAAPVSQQQRSLRPLVCFFWDRWSKDNRQPPCSRGASCQYDHTYHYGQPVAAPPDGFVSHGPDICSPTSRQTDPFIGGAIDSLPDSHLVSSSSLIQQERSSRPLVCFFWDRWNKSSSNPPCGKGSSCTFDHTYEFGQPVAPPPPGYIFRDSDVSPPPSRQTDNCITDTIDPSTGSRPAASTASSEQCPLNPKHFVCAYWDAEQRDSSKYPPCQFGATCKNLHTYVGSFPIAKFESRPVALSGSSEPRKSNSKQYVCSWWDAEQRDSSKNLPCKFGADCSDLHTYIGDFPIAGPVCFFWDQAQKSSINPPCRQGDSCKYQHDYRGGAPIALPPPGWKPPSRLTNSYSGDDFQQPHDTSSPRPRRDDSMGEELKPREPQMPAFKVPTCYFWDRAQRDPMERPCTKGDSCSFQHRYENGVPVARGPQGQAPPTRPPWNPLNPFNAICFFYFYGRKCDEGNACKYCHSMEDALPIAPSPQEQAARISKLNEVPDRSTPSSSYRQQTKPATPAIAAPTASTAPRKSVKFAIDEPMELTEEPESILSTTQNIDQEEPQSGPLQYSTVCKYWKSKSGCLRGDSCYYLHQNPSRAASSQNDDRRSGMYVNHNPLQFNRLDRDSREPIGAKMSTANEGGDMLRLEETSLDIAQNPSEARSAPVPNQPPVSKVKRKIKMDDYKRKKTLEILGTRAKEVFFGSNNTQSTILDFGDVGLPNEYEWKQVFTSTSKIVLDRLCMAEDLRLQQGFLQRCALWHGSLTAADPADMGMIKVIDQIVDELVIRAAGLVATFPEFAILLFPSKREEWGFLEQPADYPTEARLRYLIFKHDLNPEQYQDPSSKLQFGGPFRRTLMDKIHGLRLEKLLPVYLEGQNPFKFFLLFPPSQRQDADFFAAWIRASHSESQIYDSRSEGSWNFFIKFNDGFGVILIHEAITASIYKLPSLNRLINKYPNVAIWNVSDPSSAFPAFPSTSFDSGLGQVRLTRLFPHGCAFLLTPSFLAAEPEISYEILKWFLTGPKPKHFSVTPGTWKLACCHGFTDYVLDLANSKASEKETFELEHKDEPAKDSMLNEKKLSFNHCEIRYKIHKALVALEMKKPLDSDSDSGSDFNDDIENPMVQAPESIDPDDEERLINWFSGWAMQKMDLYRKFGIIGTNSSNAARASRLKEVVVAQKGSGDPDPSVTKFKAFPITNPAPGTQLPVQCPISSQKQKALEISAKYKLQTLNGQKQIQPPNFRADGSDDVSMDLESPVSTKHSIDFNQVNDVLSFVALTGIELDDAKKYLARTNNDFNRAFALYKSEGSSIDDQIVELINSDGSRNPPRLDVGHSDLQRAKESHASLSTSRRPSAALSDTTNRKRADQEPPQFDGSNDVFSAQLDGATNDRPTSSGSGSTRAGIMTDENGNRFVPRSVRPNNTIQTERPIKPGFVPDADQEFYTNLPIKDRIPQYEVGPLNSKDGSKVSSRRGSLISSPSSMSLASYEYEGSGSKRVSQRGRWDEVVKTETVMQMKEFKATSSWYRELSEAGNGWEHVTVITDWVAIKQFLGMK